MIRLYAEKLHPSLVERGMSFLASNKPIGKLNFIFPEMAASKFVLGKARSTNKERRYASELSYYFPVISSLISRCCFSRLSHCALSSLKSS